MSSILKMVGFIPASIRLLRLQVGSAAQSLIFKISVRMEMGRRIRGVFVPTDEDHVLVDADYSQIELSLAYIWRSDFYRPFNNNQDIH